MSNERLTENIIREHFKKCPNIILEEQQSENEKIKKLLKNSSKNGKADGRPDFLIQLNNNHNLVIVIECKADINKHQSKTEDNYKDYAVDGVKLYSSFLSKEYDVIAIAVSGDENNLKISHFLQLRGTNLFEPIFKNILLAINEYLDGYKKDNRKFKQDFMELLAYSRTLNDELHTLKIKESERSILIAGTLIALQNKSFYDSYKTENNITSLIDNYLSKIKNELLNVENKNIEEIITTFSFIKTHTILSKDLKVFKSIIEKIDDNINNFIKNYKYFDTLGQFYIEFLRYANNDKGLGIVLTPPHITELFCELAQINENSIILDNCAGTGGFLISAMGEMLKDASYSKERENKIKAKQIIGIELQHDIFTLLCCNMYIHGDGRSNLIKGSCFDEKTKKQILETEIKANVGFLNPPYRGDKKNDIYELEFILNNLSFLEKGSFCIAIVPTSCAMSSDKKSISLKEQLLQEHTLYSILSMPNELFFNSNVSVNSCIMVFKAKEKHRENFETLFMYCKDDGFTKRKSNGRADYDGKWKNEIKKYWINTFINKKEIEGFSVMKEVKADDEWCVEAYMETDYNKLTDKNFENELFSYMSYLFSNKLKKSIDEKSFINDKINLDIKNWQYFSIEKLFKIDGTKSIVKRNIQKIGEGNFPYITTSSINNGCGGFFDYWTEEGNVLTIDSACIGICFYQQFNFSSTDHVEKLKPLFAMNCFSALFLTTILNLEQFRYNYGRGFAQIRIKNTKIKLPVNNKGDPDFEFMENYIKSLPYSKNLEQIDRNK